MYYAMWTTSGAAAIYYILATIVGQCKSAAKHSALPFYSVLKLSVFAGGFVILNLFVAVLYTLFNDEGEDEVIPHKDLAGEDDVPAEQNDTPADTKKVPALVATVRALHCSHFV